jgi:universal stress protein E
MARVVMAAIAEPDRRAGAFVRKAAQLAKAHRARLQLVHIVAMPPISGRTLSAEVRRAADELVRTRREALRSLAARVRGVRIDVEVAWDYPAADGLVRAVLRRRPLLLVAESQRHAPLARIWLTNTDWELIRNCPCPVWLSKRPRLPARPRVLAALDPMHEHAKPAALDTHILRAALEAAGGAGKRVIAFHSVNPPAPIGIGGEGAVEAYWLEQIDEQYVDYRRRAERSLRAEAARLELPDANVAIASGPPVVTLPRTAKKHRVDVVAMGALSRRGFKRLFIGNTAERVIDELACDVLIVKPRGFASPVRRTASAGHPARR